MSLHPSEWVLERLSVDDLPREAREETERHVAGCLPCQAFLGELAGAQRERLREVPPATFVANLTRRRAREERQARRRRLFLSLSLSMTAGAMLAAAAGVLVIPRWGPLGPERPGTEAVDQVRLKGGAGVMVHRRRGDAVTALPAEAKIRAGDGLRVVVTLAPKTPAPVPVPLKVPVNAWFVDRQGRVDRLLESGPIELPPGQHALPGSAIVDSPCVDLWLVTATGPAASTLTEAEVRRLVTDGPRADASPEIQIRELGCE